MQLVAGCVFAGALLALGRWPNFDPSLVLAGGALGLLSFGSMALLYRALALGPISVVSPISASYLALTAVLVVVFLGETLTSIQVAMIVAVFAGVALASTDLIALVRDVTGPLLGVRVAFLATIGFGLWGASLAAATRVHDPLAVVLVGRAACVLAGAAALARVSPLPLPRPPGALLFGIHRRTLMLVVLMGVADAVATVAFALGADSGEAAITAAGTGAYPIVPAALAIAVLGERLAPNQYVGLAVLVLGLVGLGLAG